MRVTVRDYTPHDRQHLTECLDRMHDHMVALDPWSRLVRSPGHSAAFIRQFLQRVKSDSGFILVAEADGKPAGIAVCWVRPFDAAQRTTELPTRAGLLSDLSVLPEWRGKGIGSRLIQEAERRFREDSCDQMSLGVFAPNRDALRLYQRLGFEARGMFLGKRLGNPKARWPPIPTKNRRKKVRSE
jgi:ribosomal protein S18 acetylase RimI-like enzyme